MSISDKKLFLCNCNATLPLDAEGLARALELATSPKIHGQLCQKELASLVAADGDCLVACTQEAQRFEEAAGEAGKPQTINFVNIREAAGWSAEARAATPKIAALLAAAALPEPEPVPRVTFESQGNLLIVGPAQHALSRAGSPAHPARARGARPAGIRRKHAEHGEVDGGAAVDAAHAYRLRAHQARGALAA